MTLRNPLGRARRRDSQAFTLIEFAMILAVMMVVAALALPRLNDVILRSKRAEAATNVDGIDVALVAYMTALGDPPPDPVGLTYPDATTLGRGMQSWAPTGPEWPLGASWTPSGGVRCGYHYQAGANFSALYGVCDLNDNELFYLDARTIDIDGLYGRTSASYCCTALYTSCVASTDCF